MPIRFRRIGARLGRLIHGIGQLRLSGLEPAEPDCLQPRSGLVTVGRRFNAGMEIAPFSSRRVSDASTRGNRH
jgi:hypothetical protein